MLQYCDNGFSVFTHSHICFDTRAVNFIIMSLLSPIEQRPSSIPSYRFSLSIAKSGQSFRYKCNLPRHLLPCQQSRCSESKHLKLFFFFNSVAICGRCDQPRSSLVWRLRCLRLLLMLWNKVDQTNSFIIWSSNLSVIVDQTRAAITPDGSYSPPGLHLIKRGILTHRTLLLQALKSDKD